MKEHFLTLLRMKSTDSVLFRDAASKLSSFMAKELGESIPLHPSSIETPLAQTKGFLFQERVVLVPILRAGLAMLPAFLEIFPQSSVGFLGIRRNEQDKTAHLYYENLPPIKKTDRLFLLDPMLATGRTASLSIKILTSKGASLPYITLVSFLASKEGLSKISQEYPKMRTAIAAANESLNKDSFLVPGLGDFGDRYFGI